MPLLVLLFIVVPIAELYVIIQVGQAIGALPTIAILIADSIIGSMLLRAQGRAAWRRFNTAVGEGRMPAREVTDGVLIIFGGAFLITPGFLSDIIGLILLIPPTRAAIRALIARRFVPRMVQERTAFIWRTEGPTPGRGPQRPGPDYDVEGTAHEMDGEGPERESGERPRLPPSS
jgi:UPF0716 protein FxsA